MNPIMEKYQQLNEREQGLVKIALVVLTLFLFYFAIWAPLNQSIERNQTRVKSQQATLEWVRSNVARAEQLKTVPQQQRFTGSLTQAVNRSAREAGIAIARMQPQGDELQVWVDAAPFNDTLDWLKALEEQGIRILDADFAETDTPGFIRIRRLRLGSN